MQVLMKLREAMVKKEQEKKRKMERQFADAMKTMSHDIESFKTQTETRTSKHRKYITEKLHAVDGQIQYSASTLQKHGDECLRKAEELKTSMATFRETMKRTREQIEDEV